MDDGTEALTVDEARNIRFLRRLVTALAAVMILGMIAVVALMTLRLTTSPPPLLPEAIALPEGARALAVTVGAGWYLVVSDRGEVLVYDRATGALRQRVPLQ